MKTTRMHIAVGTMLVGLAGCASGPSRCKPPRCYSNPGPSAPIPPQEPAAPETPETAAPAESDPPPA